MKKIMNTPETMVLEMCRGFEEAHPEVRFSEQYKIISRKIKDDLKVNIISGGGSGHEPAHGGFVGKGMLDAAVCGDIFASPSQIQVYQAIKEVANKNGVFLVIKNYSGDMMNFRNAAYLAEQDGIKVDYVKVDDDIAVENSLFTVGRRGVAGTLFVHKIAGAAAELGKDLSEVKRLAEKTVANIRSIGFAFSSCTVPAKGSPTFELSYNEMEYGVGIHGEPGVHKEKVIKADELAKRMVEALVTDLGVKKNDEIALLVNGFGATPLLELYLLNNSTEKALSEYNISIYKTFVGNYMTSLDMTGASLTIMRLDDELKTLLSEPCNTPAFKIVEFNPNEKRRKTTYIKDVVSDDTFYMELDENYKIISEEHVTIENIIYMVNTMTVSAIKNEILFCEVDAHAGDGDFGMSLAKGFKELKNEWGRILAEESKDIGTFLDACSLVIMEYSGGASGPVWGGAFRAAGKYAKGKENMSLKEFAEMIGAAIEGIQITGERSFGRGAVVGDKTVIDALVPSRDSLANSADKKVPFVKAIRLAAEAARQGAENTKNIIARMGRAGAVGERSLGYPDAGAYGVGVIFNDIAESFNGSFANDNNKQFPRI